MDIKQLHNTMIGKRIQALRKKAHLLQTGIILIDSSILSKIENGKTTKRNPHLINVGQIEVISKALNVSPKDIVWGNSEEKGQFVKIIILALLLNDSDNAFQNFSVSEWVVREWNYDPVKREQLLNDIDNTEHTYGFFANPDNYALYESLHCDYDSRFERISNLILKQILHDYNFSNKFYSHIINFYTNIDMSKAEQLIKEFITNQGSYSLFILDKNGIDYPLFIYSFNKFWNKVSARYIEYFEKNIFTDEEEILENAVKKLTNDYFVEKLTSNDFIRFNEELLMLEEYSENESIISSINMRFKFISAILKGTYPTTDNTDEYDFIKYFSKVKENFDFYTDFYFNEKKSNTN